MTNHSIDSDFILNGNFLCEDNISLTAKQVEWAIELSQSVISESQKWQTYLNGLALAGVEQWLQKRSPELSLSNLLLSGKKNNFAADAMFIESICQLQVNKFQIYLIATDSLYNPDVSIPKTAVESSEFIPHFYILVEIIEELEQINVQGYLQRDRLIHYQQSIGLQSESETNYLLPLDWFEDDSDKLLLALRCLEPTAIPLISQAQIFNSYPLTSPRQQVTQNAINIGLWFRDEVDRISQELSWIILPRPSPSPEFRSLRSPVEQFNDAIAELINQRGIAIPDLARAAYRDLQWENIALRLYVVAWKLPMIDLIPEWTLLLILGTQPHKTLPLGIKLQVRDEVQILEEPVLSDRSNEYIYAQVIGTFSERFWVKISLPDGAALTLPPFTWEES
ncbi:DUF1822 family protein [Floridanema aerugineum]|uniref:DUF1822 family protein n=1 Tax=Floridaenema aerugineum BLCC-F46 TaxID=3153654 RepID=A0ABV4X6H1_9CYAN